MRYYRQVRQIDPVSKSPLTAWNPLTGMIYSTPYMAGEHPFTAGDEGKAFETQVRAFVDLNNNNTFEPTVDIASDWSNSCLVGYDTQTPVISVGTGNSNTPANPGTDGAGAEGPNHGSAYAGALKIFATVQDPTLTGYHLRLVRDGQPWGHSCGAGLSDAGNQGINKCGYAFNKTVSLSGPGFANQLIATIDSTQLPDGNYWAVIGAIDAAENRAHTDYLQDPKVLITIDNTAPAAPLLNYPADPYFTKGVAFNQTWFPSAGATQYYYESCYVDPTDGQPCPSGQVKFTQTLTGTTKNVTANQPNSHFWWHVRAHDALNNKSAYSESREVVIDNDKPLISLTTTPDVITADTTPSFAGTATDQYLAGIQSIEYRVMQGSTEITPWTLADGSFNGELIENFTLNLNLTQNGSYTVEFRAQDRANNVSDITAHTFTLDTDAPEVSLTLPTNNSFVSGTVTISGQVEDENLWRYYLVVLNSSNAVKAGPGTVYHDGPTVSPNLNWNTTLVPDGTYTIRLEARDKANNKDAGSTAVHTVTVDNTKPISTITVPTNASSSSTIITSSWNGEVAGTAFDTGSGVERVQLSIHRLSDDTYWNGSDWTAGTEATVRVDATDTSNWSYNLPTPQDDTYTIISHAQDLVGNTENSYQITIVLDRVIPEVTLSLNPAEPDGSNGWFKTQPQITLTAVHPADTDRIEYQWNSTTGTWTEYTDSFSPASEGSNVLYYRAWDIANNVSTTGIKNIAWDKTELTEGPLELTANPNPTSGTTSIVRWKDAVDNTGIHHYEVRWSLGDKSYSKSVGSDVKEQEIDQLTEGVWSVRVVAFDGAGHAKEAGINLTVDRTGPSAPTLTLAGTGVGTASLSWNAVDGASDYIVWYGTNPGEYLFAAKVGNVTNTTVQGLAGGNYYFMVRATDSLGNQSGNSNEVNTGALIGAPGALPGQPAEGFGDAGEVLGVSTDEAAQEDASTVQENGSDTTGSVLGMSTENCQPSLWSWVLVIALGLLLIASLLFLQLSRPSRVVSILLPTIAAGATLFAIQCTPLLWIVGVSLAGVLALLAGWKASAPAKPLTKVRRLNQNK